MPCQFKKKLSMTFSRKGMKGNKCLAKLMQLCLFHHVQTLQVLVVQCEQLKLTKYITSVVQPLYGNDTVMM